ELALEVLQRTMHDQPRTLARPGDLLPDPAVPPKAPRLPLSISQSHGTFLRNELSAVSYRPLSAPQSADSRSRPFLLPAGLARLATHGLTLVAHALPLV